MIALPDGPWPLGINSLTCPEYLQPGQYQWSVNTLNKGGVISTRPGFKVTAGTLFEVGRTFARGLTSFTPKGFDAPVLVVARGNSLYFWKYPYGADDYGLIADNVTFAPIELAGTSNPVCFEVAVKAVTEDEDGNISTLDEPYPVLLISDGQSKLIYWDGVKVGRINLLCSQMKWIGNRLWTMHGKKIKVSNLLDPMSYTEEDVLAEGGYFTLPEDGTGFGVTPDFRSLLAFTRNTTTAFQAGIINRATWQSTAEFQKVIFSNIGCVAPNTIVTQFGYVWWLSGYGLINLNSALQTYRSSKVSFQDRDMARSQANLADNLSSACAVAFGNYLILSVPSGDSLNYHNWVMDESVTEVSESQPVWASAWTGIRPAQWTVANVYGKQRCFAYSNNDYPVETETVGKLAATLWEAFIPDSRDMASPGVREIPCYFETKLMGDSDDLKRFSHAKIEISGISDEVRVKVSYRGKMGTYKQIMDKTITASRGSVSSPGDTQIPSQFLQWIPQKRRPSTVKETLLAADFTPSIEKPFIGERDTSFSLLIQWTGKMSIHKITMFLEEDKDAEIGVAEPNEDTARYITISGESDTTDDELTNLSFDFSENPGSINVEPSRWFEERYDCLSL